MLNMGFVDDVEKILNAGADPAGLQTLLFRWGRERARACACQSARAHSVLEDAALHNQPPHQPGAHPRPPCSATLPHWVKDITKRFLKPGHVLVDLVGTDKMKVGWVYPGLV